MEAFMRSSTRWGLLALAVGLLAGCGGGGDGGVAVGGGGGGAGALPAPNVSAPVTAAAAVAGNDTATNSAAAFSVLQDAGLPVASTASPLKINFTVFSDGAVKTGLTLSNVSVAIAKLVPGTNGTPDQWVNYIYRTESTAAAPNNVGNGAGGAPALASALQATTDAKPTGTSAIPDQLAYNSQGYYTYTFSTDIRDPAFVGPTNLTTNGVVFEPTRTHRVALQLSYTNVAGETVRVNPYYDFKFTPYTTGCTNANGCYMAVPLTTPATETRVMADIRSCNTCHNQLALHGGGRVDVQYCVMCHNSGTVDANSGNNLDMRTMVHKIHAGHMLKNGLSIWGFGSTEHNYSHVGFPQDLRNCNKCHSNTVAEGNPYQTAQGDNWKAVPSRAACGSCHDGINFATGGGTTMDPNLPWASIGHVGGAQANDALCSTCHGADAIANVYHMPVASVTSTSTSSLGAVSHYAANDNRLPAGAKTIDYEIQSVTVNGSRNPVMVFRMLQNNARMDWRTASSTTDDAVWENFSGAPTAYFAYSVPQDGITAPADFNAYVSANLLGIWNGSATGTSAGTLTGPDANGYYTVTLTGRTIPANASLLTGALGYSAIFQTNVAGFERTCTTVVKTNCVNGLNVTAQDVSKTATGFTARRITAEADRCNNCHGKLGLFTETTFHSGQRNDPKMCAMCHNPNRTSSGWSADSTAFVHGIHAASKRAVPYVWHKNDTFDASAIGFPGILSNCENCHAPGGYDFSAGGTQVASRLYRAVATASTSGTFDAISKSPYVQTDNTIYGTGYSSSDAASTTPSSTTTGLNLVNSPIANACFGCHDGDMASQPGTTTKAHFEQLGIGSIYQARGVVNPDGSRTGALARSEQCLLCHGPNSSIAPIKAAHGL
jgi:OmcA/MtrC family decaheme c-type cytochrome